MATADSKAFAEPFEIFRQKSGWRYRLQRGSNPETADKILRRDEQVQGIKEDELDPVTYPRGRQSCLTGCLSLLEDKSSDEGGKLRTQARAECLK